MNPVQLHLMVNRFPVIATPLVGLLLGWGLIRHSREIIRVAAAAAVMVAGLTYPVFLTGEPAEDKLEHVPWLQERMVHEHEERAELALIALLATGGVATVALWQSRQGQAVPPVTAGLTLAGLALSTGLLGWTEVTGSRIRHDEIRAEATASGPGREAYWLTTTTERTGDCASC